MRVRIYKREKEIGSIYFFNERDLEKHLEYELSYLEKEYGNEIRAEIK